MKRELEKHFPLISQILSFGDLHEDILECFFVAPATFKIDFGPWKAGTQVDSIAFDFIKGVVTESDNNGDTVASAKFKLQAE